MHKFLANFAKNHEVCKDFALSFFSVEQLVFVIPFLIIALWTTKSWHGFCYDAY